MHFYICNHGIITELLYKSAERQKFTVQLVKKYAWLKEEMDKTLAEKVAKEVLPLRNIEDLESYSKRRTYVGQMLKKVSVFRKH